MAPFQRGFGPAHTSQIPLSNPIPKLNNFYETKICIYLLFIVLNGSCCSQEKPPMFDVVYRVLHTLSPVHVPSFIPYKFPAPPTSPLWTSMHRTSQELKTSHTLSTPGFCTCHYLPGLLIPTPLFCLIS